INITFPGDKSTKVILNAGNGDCELQIDQPKTTPVDTPSKSKDPENTVNPKDVNDPVDSPTKPNNVNNSTDNSPVKPKDVDDSSKSKEENDPSKAKQVEDATKPKNTDDPSKSKDVNDPSKSNDVEDTSKSKDINDPSKSKDVDDPSKSKDDTDPSKSKDDTDPSKSKDVNDPSKSKDVDDSSKSKDENTPLPKPTPTNVDTPISQNNILDQLTFYSKQVTPIYGAYFAFLIALIIGASWALCSFRKRRSDNGVPYQELEMALPESSNAADVETGQGWDQDWDDDDWDEDKAIRSPGGRAQTRSISSNGLTSRATKKDGWDADWDD
nr:dentin sialophosphoprotein-like isoform X1 [Tanacetum cinerariifolium]